VPSECFTFVGSVDREREFNANNEDCRYEFVEGEPLEFLGFMDHLLPNAASLDVLWSLSSLGSSFNFDFPGGLTSFQSVNGFTATSAALNLSAAAPPGLVAGEYEIRARSIQTAPPGFSFFEYAFVTQTQCGIQIDASGTTACLLGGQVLGDTYINRSLGTRVTVLPNLAQVPEPSTLSLFLAAFGAAVGLLRRGRVREQGKRLRFLRP
jgi:hypothetical protein